MDFKTRLALATATLAFCALAQAQAWPAKPVKIVVPYPPGGAVDVVTRKMAAKLQEQTGQTFFVENKAGATGTIGLASVVQSPADGYTLAANDTTYALLPHIFKKLPFDHQKDLLPISAFVFAPMSVVVKGDSKFKTLGDLIGAAKAGADTVTYGTGGAGTTPHFVSEALGIATGVNFMHIPFKGAGEATMGMLSGTIDFQVASTPGVMGNVKGGKARILAVSGSKRLAALPDVPTFAEAGVKNFGLINFTGRLRPDGKLDLLLGNVPSPNGVALSPDERVLYLGVTRGNQVWRVPLQVDGSVAKVSAFFTSYGPSGPDGLAVDQRGCVIVANPGLGVVWVLNHKAEPEVVLRSCAGASLTNVAFGGPDRKTLYCTESVSGSVLRATLGEAGLPVHRGP